LQSRLFSANPFLRISFPFIAGILCGIVVGTVRVPIIALIASLITLPALSLYEGLSTTLRRVLFAASVDVFFFLFGLSAVRNHDPAAAPDHYSRYPRENQSQMVAVVRDIPREKEKSVRLDLSVLKIAAGGKWRDASGRIYLYAKKEAPMPAYRAGDVIAFSSQLRPVSPPKNPEEFNYSQYLSDRGVYHTAFAQPDAIHVIDHGVGLNPIWKAGLACKAYVLRRLRSSGISNEAAAICAALLTGYDADIDSDTRDAFAHSGTLHVLSVSGLHTGLLYLALGWLFGRFDPHNRRAKLRMAFVTLFLWTFALITGFSPPVLRAVIMFTLLGIGGLFFRGRNNTINLLLVSAFILLIYNPYYIRDVGFLLSYFAMAGLLVIQPVLSSKWRPASRGGRYVWESVTASVAATIATLPLTLWFFKQFPIWFVVSNLVVVPLSFAILLLAAAMLLVPIIIPHLINALVAAMAWFIGLFDNSQFGYVGRINFNGTDALFLSGLLIVLAYALRYRSGRALQASLLLIATWQVVSLTGYWRDVGVNSLTVYESGRNSIVSIKKGPNVSVMSSDEGAFRFHAEPHLTSLSPRQINNDVFNLVAGSEGEAALILNSPEPCDVADSAAERIGTLVLCKGRTINAGELSRFPVLTTIVVDGSHSARNCREIAELCGRAGLAFHSTARDGAFTMQFK
jgi:competence protein ComEC